MNVKIQKRIKAVAKETWESIAPSLEVKAGEPISNLFVMHTVIKRGNMEKYGNDPDAVERFRKLPLEKQYQFLAEHVFTEEIYEV